MTDFFPIKFSTQGHWLQKKILRALECNYRTKEDIGWYALRIAVQAINMSWKHDSELKTADGEKEKVQVEEGVTACAFTVLF